MRTPSCSSAIGTLIAGLLCQGSVFALATPMRIAVVASDEMARALGAGTTIDLAGEIQADTPQKLREALAALPRDRSWTFVRFNSPGGDLFAAMEMGRILRAAGAITQVGA